MSTIHAIFQDGVFKPIEPISLPNSCEVELQILSPTTVNPQLEQALAQVRHRTPAQIEAARERILKASRPARALPEGKTLADVVEGQWPSDETEEQIREALERLS